MSSLRNKANKEDTLCFENVDYAFISGFVITGIILVTTFLFSSPDAQKATYAFFPVHFVVTVISLILFSAIIYVIYKIQISNMTKLAYHHKFLDLKKIDSDNTNDFGSKVCNCRKLIKLIKTELKQDEWDNCFEDDERLNKAIKKLLKDKQVSPKDKIEIEELCKNDEIKECGDLKQCRKYVGYLRSQMNIPESNKALPVRGMEASASIALASLVITTGGVFLANFLETPILDYNAISDSELNKNEFGITLNNLGSATAENVLITFEDEDDKGISFDRFFSYPYISKYFSFNSSNDLKQALGFARIDKLPAFSTTLIKAEISNLSTNEGSSPDVKVNIRSDETVGATNIIYVMLFYVVLATVYFIFSMLLWMGKIRRIRKNTFWVAAFVAQGAFLGIAFLWFSFRI